MNAIILTDEQNSALSALSEAEDSFLLKGYAGTGKTTIIVEWVNNLKSGKSVVLTAPTNKAANVLADKARELDLPVDVSTIHSLLGLKLKWKEGEQILVPDNRDEPKFLSYDYIVIDETSMVNEELLEHINFARSAHPSGHWIFMGDPCQLPPINEEESKTFANESSAELTTVLRQAEGNPIQELGVYIRNLILHDPNRYPARIWDFIDDENIQHWPSSSHEDLILGRMAYEDEDNRILAWTNKVVDAWNDKVREAFYGTSPPEWMKGEHIVTLQPVMNQYDSGMLFSTDTLLTISREPVEVEHLGLPCWKLTCRGQFLFVPQRQAIGMYKAMKEEKLQAAKQDKKLWRKFYQFVEGFSWVRPAHALTVHRSQGSTFDNVFVNLNNVLANPRKRERLQCLYVACTRPRSRLILI